MRRFSILSMIALVVMVGMTLPLTMGTVSAGELADMPDTLDDSRSAAISADECSPADSQPLVSASSAASISDASVGAPASACRIDCIFTCVTWLDPETGWPTKVCWGRCVIRCD